MSNVNLSTLELSRLRLIECNALSIVKFAQSNEAVQLFSVMNFEFDQIMCRFESLLNLTENDFLNMNYDARKELHK